MPLKEVGNGINQFVPEAAKKEDLKSPLDTVKDTISLVDLAQRVQNNPLETALKQAELQIKASQIKQIPIELEQERIQNVIAQNQEFRAQANQKMQVFEKLPGLFAQNFEMGQAVAKSVGLNAFQNKNGTVGILASDTSGAPKVYTIDPMDIADPKTKIELERNFRQDWEPVAKNYGIISTAYKNIEKLAANATGVSDVALLYNYIKLLDPGSVVREGEVKLSNPQNVPDWVVSSYKNAFSTGAPVLAQTNRDNIRRASKQLYDTARETTVSFGKNLGGIVENSKLRKQNVITNAGDLTFESIFGDTKQVTENAPPATTQPASTNSQVKPSANEAGLIPGEKPVAPKVNLNDALNNWKRNFVKPRGN
jgi:hypothetical protein